MVRIIKFNLLISHIIKSCFNRMTSHSPSHPLLLCITLFLFLFLPFSLFPSFFLSSFPFPFSLFPSFLFFSGSLVGAQLVVTSDDGYVVTWNGNSLRQQSEEMYVCVFPSVFSCTFLRFVV